MGVVAVLGNHIKKRGGGFSPINLETAEINEVGSECVRQNKVHEESKNEHLKEKKRLDGVSGRGVVHRHYRVIIGCSRLN